MKTSTSFSLFLGGRLVQGRGGWHDLRRVDDQQALGRISLAGPEDFEAAVAAAEASRPILAQEAGHQRQQRLLEIASALADRREAFEDLLIAEAGKPLRHARAEVERAIRTFHAAAEESVRIPGEYMDLGMTPQGKGRQAWVRPHPIGVCAFITPFNFPLNLVAHKVAPALAVGCPWVLKPAEKTPRTALLLGELLSELSCPLPPGSWSILPALPAATASLVRNPKVRHLSFTGSAAVGWRLKGEAAHAQVVLELGGNAGAIVEPDWDLETALDGCAVAAFAYSGQVCISLQRLWIHQSRFDQAVEGMKRRATALRRGPLKEAATEIGPMIDEQAAARVESWIQKAVDAGAKLHCGGQREGRFLAPAVLTEVPDESPLWREEVFGPVVCLRPYQDFGQALAELNDSEYGLQASVFSHDWRRIEQAWSQLEVGQVLIGQAPAWRVDDMPYGGVKQSGTGREGVRYAMEAMTEPRLLVL
ncbi:MAG: aldehyde dehydrogenase family protein [Planctomycetota bacterium]|nr:MAG: aldehyde dehydrogenase family protein [Planctomycetota bacterium]